MAIFKTPARDYDLLATEFVCNKFGLAEFFAENFPRYNLKFYNVLDVGCGAGSLSIYLAEQFAAKVSAVDINPQAVDCCRNNIVRYNLVEKISVTEGNFAQLYKTFAKNSFELIISNPPIGINSEVNFKFTAENFDAMNYAKYKFLTNNWRDESGFDLTEYILIAGKYLLTEGGNIILICCDVEGNPEQYIKNQAHKYNYELDLLFKDKIAVTKLGINFLNMEFVNGYIWLLKNYSQT